MRSTLPQKNAPPIMNAIMMKLKNATMEHVLLAALTKRVLKTIVRRRVMLLVGVSGIPMHSIVNLRVRKHHAIYIMIWMNVIRLVHLVSGIH